MVELPLLELLPRNTLLPYDGVLIKGDIKMSTTYSVMPARFYNWFDESIHAVAWQQSKFLNWFAGFPGTKLMNGPVNGPRNKLDGGLIRSVEEGLENVITFKWEKMKPGQVAGSLQEAPIQRHAITELEGPLMHLATRLAIKQSDVDAWRHNKYIASGDLIPQVIRQAMMPLVNQVDQFITYGDDFKTPLAFDRLGGKGLGKFTGLFNGFQTTTAGAGNDDKVGQAGDMITTYVNFRSLLRAQGFDKGPYYILTDETTQKNAETGNLLYKTGTKPITEYSSILAEYKYKQGQLADWIESINAFPGSSSTSSRICLTQPYISQFGRKIEPSYLLYIGYNFRVFPLWAGGLNGNAEYEFLIATSIRLQQIHDYSLYRSTSALSFT